MTRKTPAPAIAGNSTQTRRSFLKAAGLFLTRMARRRESTFLCQGRQKKMPACLPCLASRLR